MNITIKWILHNVVTLRALISMSDTDCPEIHEEYYRSWVNPKHVLKGETIVEVPDDYQTHGYMPFEIKMPIGEYTAKMVDQMSAGWIQSQGVVCPTIEQAEQAFSINLDVVRQIIAELVNSYIAVKAEVQ